MLPLVRSVIGVVINKKISSQGAKHIFNSNEDIASDHGIVLPFIANLIVKLTRNDSKDQFATASHYQAALLIKKSQLTSKSNWIL